MFKEQGFQIQRSIITNSDCKELVAVLSRISLQDVGTRNLLNQSWCQQLAKRLRSHPAIVKILEPDAVAFQCNFFEKSSSKNWLVTVHQDLSIPVNGHVDHPDLCNWSIKEDILYVQPPLNVLAKLVAVRVHLDSCHAQDGALRVVPKSHTIGIINASEAPSVRDRLGETLCTANAGDALILSPLTLHASSKATGTSRHRVLHFIFGPATLPYGLEWPLSV